MFRLRVRGFGTQAFRVHSKLPKLEQPYPHAPKGILKGIPALIILKPCSNFLEFTAILARFRAEHPQGSCLSGFSS